MKFFENTSFMFGNCCKQPRGVDGDKQHESNSSANCVIVSPGLNKFQVLRDLRENYPCSELSSCNQDVSTSVVPESPSKVVISTHFPSQKKSKELTVTPGERIAKFFLRCPKLR